ncbi:hypothetical protein QA597_06070 [Marinilabiliaceae bacterium ANBcel2]|nr:hypothetical protein [Marinilabiliaceae bacterium ANBcel2]
MSSNKSVTTKGLYKNLVLRIKNLIIKPGEEWKSIHRENKSINEILSDFSLPLIALCAVATFINFAINHQAFNSELAIKHATVSFASLFVGLYLSFLMLKWILPKMHIPASPRLIFSIVAYPSGLWYIITFIINLIPELIILHLLTFYSIYIIWHAVSYLPGIRIEHNLVISVLIAGIIHITPYFIKFALLKIII